MNLRTILHLTTTEIRRSYALLLALFFFSIVFPSIELFFLFAVLTTAQIALGDHWNRTTAQWRIRPASGLELTLSRVLLALLFFALPAAIQQGWVIHQTGLGQEAARLAALDGAMYALTLFGIAFAIASLADGWRGFVVNLILSLLIFYLLLISLSFFDFISLSSFVEKSLHISLVVLFFPGLFFVIRLTRRAKTHRHRLALIVGMATYAVLLFSSSIHSWVKKRSSKPILLSEGKAGEGSDYRAVARNHRITGLKENEFIKLSGGWSGTPQYDPETSQIKPVNELAAYNARSSTNALFQTLIEERVFLQQSKARKRLPSQDEMLDLGNFPNIGVGVYQLREVTRLPLRDGASNLAGDLHFSLEDLGLPQNQWAGRKFRLQLSRPKRKMLTVQPESDWRFRFDQEGRWKLIADHPALGEAIPILVSMRETQSEHTGILHAVQTLEGEFTLLADAKWSLLWPDKDITQAWLDEAVLRIYEEEWVWETGVRE